MKNVITTIILVAIIYVSGCAIAWQGFQETSVLSVQLTCNGKNKAAVNFSGSQSWQYTFFGSVCKN